MDDHAGLNGGERGAFVLRNVQLGFDDGIGVERLVDCSEQSGNAFAGKRRDRGLRPLTFWTGIDACHQRRALVFRKQVNFIKDFNAGLGERFELAEDFFYLRLLLFAVGGGGVADVEQHLGVRDLLQCCAEAGDQRVGQIANEADCIRQQNLAPAWQFDGAELRVECGEHARGRKHLGAGDRVEERALAGVGVANQSNGRYGDSFAALALLAADAADGVERALEVINAALDAAAIGFELGFAGPASADAAAELGHGFAAAGEARQHVFELSELDLELALARAGVTGKDVEDELRAIENAAGQGGFEIAQLRGRKVVIEENQIGLRRGGDGSDLFDFSGADERGGIGTRAALDEFGGYLAAGAQQQFAKFGERLFDVEAGRD